MNSFLRFWPLLLCFTICGCEGRNYGSEIFQSFDPTKTLVSIGKSRNLNITLGGKHKDGEIYAGSASIFYRYHTYSDVGNVEPLANEISTQIKKGIQDLGATIENSYESNGSIALRYFNYELDDNQGGSVRITATKTFQSTQFEVEIYESEQTESCNP